MPLFHNVYFYVESQKCLDKDPSKRWTCDKLLTHPLFDDYIAKRKEIAAEQYDAIEANRTKSKVRIIQKSVIESFRMDIS